MHDGRVACVAGVAVNNGAGILDTVAESVVPAVAASFDTKAATALAVASVGDGEVAVVGGDGVPDVAVAIANNGIREVGRFYAGVEGGAATATIAECVAGVLLGRLQADKFDGAPAFVPVPLAVLVAANKAYVASLDFDAHVFYLQGGGATGKVGLAVEGAQAGCGVGGWA